MPNNAISVSAQHRIHRLTGQTYPGGFVPNVQSDVIIAYAECTVGDTIIEMAFVLGQPIPPGYNLGDFRLIFLVVANDPLDAREILAGNPDDSSPPETAWVSDLITFHLNSANETGGG